MSFIGKDDNGNSVTFERLDPAQLIYELVVEHCGNRGSKNPKDGLTNQHRSLIEDLLKVVSMVDKDSYERGLRWTLYFSEESHEVAKEAINNELRPAVIKAAESKDNILSKWRK